VIVHGDRLWDTYWRVGQSFSGCRSFGLNDLFKIELTRLGNLSDLEKAPEYQAEYYDDADIVDLNHANSTKGNFYLRKGAVRSQKKMLEVARSKLERSLSEERYAVQESERFHKAISKIEAGELDIYL